MERTRSPSPKNFQGLVQFAAVFVFAFAFYGSKENKSVSPPIVRCSDFGGPAVGWHPALIFACFTA